MIEKVCSKTTKQSNHKSRAVYCTYGVVVRCERDDLVLAAPVKAIHDPLRICMRPNRSPSFVHHQQRYGLAGWLAGWLAGCRGWLTGWLQRRLAARRTFGHRLVEEEGARLRVRVGELEVGNDLAEALLDGGGRVAPLARVPQPGTEQGSAPSQAADVSAAGKDTGTRRRVDWPHA